MKKQTTISIAGAVVITVFLLFYKQNESHDVRNDVANMTINTSVLNDDILIGTIPQSEITEEIVISDSLALAREFWNANDPIFTHFRAQYERKIAHVGFDKAFEGLNFLRDADGTLIPDYCGDGCSHVHFAKNDFDNIASAQSGNPGLTGRLNNDPELMEWYNNPTFSKNIETGKLEYRVRYILPVRIMDPADGHITDLPINVDHLKALFRQQYIEIVVLPTITLESAYLSDVPNEFAMAYALSAGLVYPGFNAPEVTEFFNTLEENYPSVKGIPVVPYFMARYPTYHGAASTATVSKGYGGARAIGIFVQDGNSPGFFNSIDTSQLIAHEMGHNMTRNHSSNSDDIMYPFAGKYFTNEDADGMSQLLADPPLLTQQVVRLNQIEQTATFYVPYRKDTKWWMEWSTDNQTWTTMPECSSFGEPDEIVLHGGVSKCTVDIGVAARGFSRIKAIQYPIFGE